MKSKLSFALGVALLSTTALASAPCGLYGGVEFGFSQINMDIKLETSDDGGGPINADEQLLKQRKSIIGRAFIGHQAPVWHNCFLAGELFVAPRDYTYKIKGIVTRDPDAGLNAYEDARLKIERSLTLGATVKFGRYFDEKTAVYAGLSLNGSNMKISFAEGGGIAGQEGSDKKFLLGVAPSVGIIHHFTEKDRVHLGYVYESQKTWKTKDLDSSGSTFKAKLNTSTHNFMVSYSRFF